MADSKITALTAISTVDPTADPLVIVDVSDTSMAASGTTKKSTINQLLGSGGTATLASATITGAATVGTTLGVTGASTLASVGVTGAATVGTTLLVGTNATLTNGNVIIGTSGKGIDFSATASGSGTMTSELLNDYEEGTFTPTVAFGGASVGVVYAQVIGIYTKVGRIVHFSGRVDLSNKGTSTGSATITGLPFNANIGAASVGYQLSAAPSGAQVMLTISSTILTVRYATGTTTAESTDANFANNSIIIFGGTYAI